MGSGIWSTNVYDAAASYRAATGASAFAYSDGGARQAHPALDPRNAGTRESRDSDEHPESLALAVLFDVTGSMRTVPRTLQSKLPDLLGLLTRKGYATDPHLMFGAIGDATCDRVPLQVGQFESDNRMDDDLGRILLEGGGGGQMTEFDVSIKPAEGEPFQTTISQSMLPAQLEGIAEGAAITVKYDPDSPMSALIYGW